MIVPDEIMVEMIRDMSTLSIEFATLIKNLQPRDGADVARVLTAAKTIRTKLQNIVETLMIVTEENIENVRSK